MPIFNAIHETLQEKTNFYEIFSSKVMLRNTPVISGSQSYFLYESCFEFQGLFCV